jgi:flagellar biosynthesis protein FlhF
MQVLERNLRTDAKQAAIYEQGGVFALVGSTGVGKTTTTPSWRRCGPKHGAPHVGLITLDTYRIGGHDSCAPTAACWAWWPIRPMTRLRCRTC